MTTLSPHLRTLVGFRVKWSIKESVYYRWSLTGPQYREVIHRFEGWMVTGISGPMKDNLLCLADGETKVRYVDVAEAELTPVYADDPED